MLSENRMWNMRLERCRSRRCQRAAASASRCVLFVLQDEKELQVKVVSRYVCSVVCSV